MFKSYFDNEVEEFIVNSTQNYNRQENDHSFVLSKDQLWDFLVITIISSFNIRLSFISIAAI